MPNRTKWHINCDLQDRWSLLTFVNGIANLAANITNKELIGAEGIIKSLFGMTEHCGASNHVQIFCK